MEVVKAGMLALFLILKEELSFFTVEELSMLAMGFS
jgi:hypothetical protein